MNVGGDGAAGRLKGDSEKYPGPSKERCATILVNHE